LVFEFLGGGGVGALVAVEDPQGSRIVADRHSFRGVFLGLSGLLTQPYHSLEVRQLLLNELEVESGIAVVGLEGGRDYRYVVMPMRI